MKKNLPLNSFSRYKELLLTSSAFSLFSLLMIFIYSCKEKEWVEPETITSTNENVNAASHIQEDNLRVGNYCGEIKSVILYAGKSIPAGTVQTFNDENNVYVTYQTNPDWKLKELQLYVGDLKETPLNNAVNPMVGRFPYKQIFTTAQSTFTFRIPMNRLNSCFIVAAHAVVVKYDANGGALQTETGWGAGTRFNLRGNWATYFNYCKQACTQCFIQAGDYRTQTQGGWGSTPNGSNPGSYLQQNFSKAFPNGLTVGFKNTIRFTSSSAINTFLPQGGPARALNTSLVNPTDINNVFAGQVTALSLSVGFDKADPGFGLANGYLENLVVSNGSFKDMSVKMILEEANIALGGGITPHTIQELNEVVSKINENFVDGKMNNGFLSCR